MLPLASRLASSKAWLALSTSNRTLSLQCDDLFFATSLCLSDVDDVATFVLLRRLAYSNQSLFGGAATGVVQKFDSSVFCYVSESSPLAVMKMTMVDLC